MRTLRTLLLPLLLLAAPLAGQQIQRPDSVAVRAVGGFLYTVIALPDSAVVSQHSTWHRALTAMQNRIVRTGEPMGLLVRAFLEGTPVWVDGPPEPPVVEDPPEDDPDPEPDPDDPEPDPDPQPDPDPDPEPQPDPDPPTDPSGAILLEDWAYSSVAAMFAGPVYDATTRGGAVELIDVQGEPFNRAVRARFDANQGNEPQVGVVLPIPAGHREIWIEFDARFSANWTTHGPGAGNPDFKFLFLFDADPTGLRRWAHNMGVFGSSIGVYIAGNGTNYDGADRLFDGQWHRYRYHADMATSTWEVWIDGTRYASGTTVPPSRFAGLDFRWLSLSINLNRGTDRTQTVDYGPVRLWTTDPGW